MKNIENARQFGKLFFNVTLIVLELMNMLLIFITKPLIIFISNLLIIIFILIFYLCLFIIPILKEDK